VHVQPYQERGVQDKERYKNETREYREKLKTGFFDNPANGQEKTGDVISPEGAVTAEPALSSFSVPPALAESLTQLMTEETPAPSLVPTQ
jgi:hypothetical protein